jgi:glycosyltransferase involved in cell wall biosynthesis
VIAGDGPLADQLKALASARGVGSRVTWTGYIEHDRTTEFYRSIDVLVLPSRARANIKEQFGRVVVEALACGVPVVTSDCGELPRLVARTQGGWIFPQRDAGALAAVLGRLRGRPQLLRSVGDRGRRRVIAEFGMDSVAGRFVAAIEDAVRGRRAA